ncbi:unnamed protein product [Gordionus sp. m RMFG-2023]
MDSCNKCQSAKHSYRCVITSIRLDSIGCSHANTIYLSLEDQQNLGYQILGHLKLNSYTRKNVGYLYAIQHGAKFIYDTDDDNTPLNFDYFTLKSRKFGTYPISNDTVFNPYPHFGQSSIWPRGYPLDAIGDYKWVKYFKSCHTKTPSIQQGVVNGDPDVDALFRMSRKSNNEEFKIEFSKVSPNIILPSGLFAPYNSQNTLFHYEAFWSLVLPVGVSFRTCDIWRGYFGQRLMWLIDQNLEFVAPTAFQKRNSHNYMMDAQNEIDVYFKTRELIKFLSHWKCGTSSDIIGVSQSEWYNKVAMKSYFPKCIVKLAVDMNIKGFWPPSDVNLIIAWIKDLKKVGYTFPTMISLAADAIPFSANKLLCTNEWQNFDYQLIPKESNFPLPNMMFHSKKAGTLDFLSTRKVYWERLGSLNTYEYLPGVLLIVIIDSVYTLDIIFLKNLYVYYGKAFTNTLFCVHRGFGITSENIWELSHIGVFIIFNDSSNLFNDCIFTVSQLGLNHLIHFVVPYKPLIKYWKIPKHVFANKNKKYTLIFPLSDISYNSSLCLNSQMSHIDLDLILIQEGDPKNNLTILQNSITNNLNEFDQGSYPYYLTWVNCLSKLFYIYKTKTFEDGNQIILSYIEKNILFQSF